MHQANVNQGVPRLKELLSVSRNLKSPMDTIILKEPYCFNKEYSQKVLNELAITTIKQITRSTEILFNLPNQDITSEDAEILKIHRVFDELDVIPDGSNKSPWILRFVLDKMKMRIKILKCLMYTMPKYLNLIWINKTLNVYFQTIIQKILL